MHSCKPLLLLIALLLLQACASPPQRLAPLPAHLAQVASIPGIPQARQWGDEVPANFQAWLKQPEAKLRQQQGGIMHRPHNYLVISGGGSNGAFAAGLLVGWTARGNRPEFQIVTGTSTGALAAPFAFLGSSQDAKLRQVYTQFSTHDLVERRGIWDMLTGDGLVSTSPLRRLIAQHIDATMITAIAEEGRKGRSLLIGTTHLDAARPVIWDITRIAASQQPGAAALIHEVILASASIPGAFPPVPIQVEADGRRYDEVHVDGGVTAQLFLTPRGLDWQRIKQRLGVKGRPQLYVIRNAKLRQDWSNVPLRLPPLISRTISTLILNQGIGDISQLYLMSQQHGMDFRLAHIPLDFSEQSDEIFDPDYMRKLFDFGHAKALHSDPWMRPDLDAAAEAPLI
ncbi:MAG: patatin-like phospholipase family protein [Gammaproteobacteria bacterium]|nr:patatin-like phospholipase family protein [Gammaproteobacteria bacterium]